MDLSTVQEKILPHLENCETYLQTLRIAQENLVKAQQNLATVHQNLVKIQSELSFWTETLNNDILLLDTVESKTEAIRIERKEWIVYIQQQISKLSAIH